MSNNHTRPSDPGCPEQLCNVMKTHKDGSHAVIEFKLGQVEKHISHIPLMRAQLWIIMAISGAAFVLICETAKDHWMEKKNGGGASVKQSVAAITSPAVEKFQPSSLSELR